MHGGVAPPQEHHAISCPMSFLHGAEEIAVAVETGAEKHFDTQVTQQSIEPGCVETAVDPLPNIEVFFLWRQLWRIA